MPPLLPTDYNAVLVCLSIAIAMLTAYTALNVAGRVNATQGRSQLVWLVCGAMTMGIGIWAMHFIGMLAFRVSVPVHYHFGKVVLSVLPAMVAAGLTLYIVSRERLSWLNLTVGSVLMGVGIAAMHYAGMAAIETTATVRYSTAIVGISIGIAIAVSFAALVIIFQLREESAPKQTGKKILAALLMGLAIPTMHYTGMAAVSFRAPSADKLSALLRVSAELQTPENAMLLSSTVVVSTLVIFGVAWISTFLDRRLSAQITYSEALQASKAALKQQTQELSQTLKEVKSLQSQLIQSEKMSSMGHLVAGIAHEINNPVGFIYGNLAHVERYMKDLLTIIEQYQQHYPQPNPILESAIADFEPDFIKEDVLKLISSMQVGTERISAIVKSLRSFSRMDEFDLKPADIHEGIDSTLMLLQHRLKHSSRQGGAIEVVRDYDALPSIECYPGQLNQVFMNILTNAIDAIEEASEDTIGKDSLPTISGRRRLTIRTALIGSDWIEIAIADSGPGIPGDIQHQIFDPFFTTKPIGKGTGLGMSVSYKIVVEEHGGKLDVFSAPDRETTFCIQLPICQQAEAA